jgi:hypothetical protein
MQVAENDDEPKPPSQDAPEPEPPPADLSVGGLLRSLREFLRREAATIIKAGDFALWGASRIKDAIANTITELEFLEFALPSELIRLALEQPRTAADPPKTLSELQTQPTANTSGYDVHHIVQQNPSNVAKSPAEFRVEKFGWNAIDAPGGPGARLRGQIVGDEDFASQYADGLATLRMFGVLQ